jgi:hypothetical protein
MLRGAAAGLVCGWAAAFLWLPAQPALAAQADPRLASLRIDIWPEFDRPGVLVILKGELTAETPLPAAVSLRIPAPAGRPAAVAFGSAASELFNLPYETSSDGKDLTVRFSAPQRSFHVEYYDTLQTNGPQRNYAYVWRGDLPVRQLSVSLQEPAGATGFSVLPAFGSGTRGPEGLTYRKSEFGSFDAGQQFVLTLAYNKADARTSAQILNLATPAPAPPAPAVAGPPGEVNVLQLVLIIAGALVAILSLAFAGWWLATRRARTAAARAPAAGFCSKCGNALAAGDRFCSACGKPLGKRKNP